jgi:hypothetical protein
MVPHPRGEPAADDASINDNNTSAFNDGTGGAAISIHAPGAVDGSGYGGPDPTTAPASEPVAINVSPSPSAQVRPAVAATDLGNILR